MPVNFGFSSENAKALLFKLGVSNVDLAAISAMGWGVKLTATEMALVKGDVKHVMPITLSTMQDLSSGKLGPLALATLVKQVKAMDVS